ncbi:MAG: hypothetical protein Fur0018_09470 [Anaerolineales bacterium]
MNLPLSLWAVAWREQRRAGFALIVKLLYPVVTVAFMLLGKAPLHIAASVIVLLIAFMTVVDLGLSWARERREGMLARLALTPLSPRRVVFERLAASVAMDALQTLPVALLLALFYRPPLTIFLTLLAALFGALLASNVLSLLVTLLPGGRREVILYAVIVVFALLFLGGVFRPIGPAEGVLNLIAHLTPYAALHQAIRLSMLQQAIWTLPDILLDSALLSAAFAVILAALAPRLVR